MYEIINDSDKIRNKEEQKDLLEKIQKLKNLLEPKAPLDLEIEELKQKHADEINQIIKQKEEDKAAYEKDRELWIAQRREIEEELNNLKDQSNAKIEEHKSISYDANWIIPT